MQIRPMTGISILVLLLSLVAQNIEMRLELSAMQKDILRLASLNLELANAAKMNADSIEKLAQVLHEHSQMLGQQDQAVVSLVASVRALDRRQKSLQAIFPPIWPDRCIVITDEQSHESGLKNPAGKGYFINVASNRNGIGYGKWTHIDGWSEAVLDYIQNFEHLDSVEQAM